MNPHSTNHTPPRTVDPAVVWPPATLAERDALRRLAMTRAHELRAEAIAEFWSDAGRWWHAAADQSRRAADRLAARLRQHAKHRDTGSRTIEV
ncbi:MAG TPA: hypothetical protein VI032_05140 [Burkholderiaceae bacterium]